MTMLETQKRLWQLFWMIVGLYVMFFIQDVCIRSGIDYQLREQQHDIQKMHENNIEYISNAISEIDERMIKLRLIEYDLKGKDY